MELITQLAAKFAEEQGVYRLLVSSPRSRVKGPADAEAPCRSSTRSSHSSGSFSIVRFLPL